MIVTPWESIYCKVLLEAKTEIFRLYLKSLNGGNIGDLKVVVNKQAVFEFPYALPKYPKIVRGVDNICDYLLDSSFSRYFHNSRIIDIENSDLIFAEIDGTEFYPTTAKSYDQQIVCLVTIMGKQIHHYKEYFDPLTRLEGMLDLQKENLD